VQDVQNRIKNAFGSPISNQNEDSPSLVKIDDVSWLIVEASASKTVTRDAFANPKARRVVDLFLVQ